MIPLIVIRPEPGCSASVAAARDLGLEAVAAPLFEISGQVWDAPDPAEFDGLLVGSANVFRRGGAALEAYRGLVVHVVGTATAAAAEAAGFTVGITGSGGLQRVLERVQPGSRLLRLAGAERIELTVPAGVTMTERTVYTSRPLPMGADLAERLARPAVVALHSAEAARHFAAECARLGIARGHLALAAIGPRVNAAVGGGWRTVSSAAKPDETALLAKARELCQTALGN